MNRSSQLAVRTALTFTLLLILSPALSPQDEPCLRRSFVVTVADNDGNPVSGLSAANFRGEFRGRPVKILSVEPDMSRRRAVVLLDQSSSMTSSDQGGRFVNDLAAEVVMNAAQSGMVAFMAFSARAEPVAGFETPTDVIIQRVRGLPSILRENPKRSRKTALWDGILAAQELFQVPKAGDLICVMTDGGENKSKARVRDTELALLSKRTRLIAIIVPSWMIDTGPQRHYRRPEEDAGAYVLTKLAIRSGGDAISLAEHRTLSSEENIRAVVNEVRALFRTLSSCYHIEVEFPKSESKPEPWKLEVFDGSSKMKNVELSYPRKLMPCSEKK